MTRSARGSIGDRTDRAPHAIVPALQQYRTPGDPWAGTFCGRRWHWCLFTSCCRSAALRAGRRRNPTGILILSASGCRGSPCSNRSAASRPRSRSRRSRSRTGGPSPRPRFPHSSAISRPRNRTCASPPRELWSRSVPWRVRRCQRSCACSRPIPNHRRAGAPASRSAGLTPRRPTSWSRRRAACRITMPACACRRRCC